LHGPFHSQNPSCSLLQILKKIFTNCLCSIEEEVVQGSILCKFHHNSWYFPNKLNMLDHIFVLSDVSRITLNNTLIALYHLVKKLSHYPRRANSSSIFSSTSSDAVCRNFTATDFSLCKPFQTSPN
jgi:hypothetical protein